MGCGRSAFVLYDRWHAEFAPWPATEDLSRPPMEDNLVCCLVHDKLILTQSPWERPRLRINCTILVLPATAAKGGTRRFQFCTNPHSWKFNKQWLSPVSVQTIQLQTPQWVLPVLTLSSGRQLIVSPLSIRVPEIFFYPTGTKTHNY